ncbi:MAG: DNA repair protein RadC [Ruminococcaceae bacterium]|nr:DNA repair protein RadC [Oscillospiraceae bacterium]
MHEHHRQRMRERLRGCDFDHLATHELLEFLLFYAIPRSDTNKLAHGLLERFGSLRELFEASAEELTEVEGIGENSALLLKLIPAITRRYAEEQRKPSERYDSVSKLATFFVRRFIGDNRECLYMMLLNNRMNMIDCVKISEGSVNCSEVPVRRMTELALSKKASSVVLAHNHPNGLAIPSGNDLDVTDHLNNAFHMLGITLLEHLVIADDRFMPIMKQHCGIFRCIDQVTHIESRFDQNFYDVDEAQWRCPPIFPPNKRECERGESENTI